MNERRGRWRRRPLDGARLRSRMLVVFGLIAVWVLVWGDLSAANVVSGLAVAVLVLVLFPLPDEAAAGVHLRPLPLVALVAFFTYELVQSNITMARDLLGRRDRMRTGVIAYPLRVQSDALLTFLANVTALTPGAMPIDVDHEPRVLFVHVTRVHERAATLANLARYEELFVRSFGSHVQLAELHSRSVASEVAT
jgi:multicomponent Na+:H+ antiporter subunit E